MKRIPIAMSALALMVGTAVAQDQPMSPQQQDGAEQTQPRNGGQGAAQAGGKAGGQDQAGAAVLLVPIDVVADPKLSDGCWARLYSEQGFEGDMLTVTGPIAIEDMDDVFNPWGGVDSAAVGPNATLIAYDDEDFEDQSATLQAGQEVAEMSDEKLGLFEDIESLRLTCS